MPPRSRHGVALAAAAFAAALPGAAAERPVCQLAESLVGSVGAHLGEWDGQVLVGLNETMNCSLFLEFVYLSRDRIRLELEYIRGNFTAEEEAFKAEGRGGGSTTWAMTHMSTAASLVSAHLHIHGILSAARPHCLSENLQLLFLMSLRRLKALLMGQLRHLWVIFQGTAELFRQGAGRWLSEVVELFEADLRTMETIMVSWKAPADEPLADEGTGALNTSRPGPPLPPFSEREEGGVALSTVEILRRDMFEEWDLHKPLLRGLLRRVFPLDSHVADFCAGNGRVADFLNDTGLVTAYAFDPSSNIRLLSRGVVDFVEFHVQPLRLWRNFDFIMCLTVAKDFDAAGADVLARIWRNIDGHASDGAVLSCGVGDFRQQFLHVGAEHAPALVLDEHLTESLRESGGEDVCVFRRGGGR